MAGFEDREFWNKFENSVVQMHHWKISKSTETLWKVFVEDDVRNNQVLLSPPNFKQTIFRRVRALLWREEEERWASVLTQVRKEILENPTQSSLLSELDACGLLNSLKDYVEHLHFFQTIALEMELKLKTPIKALGYNDSPVHDIDKIDPIMVAGYAEKFDDGIDSNLWKFCVNHHITTNPHHQGHPLWAEGNCEESGKDKNECNHCFEMRQNALLEMICDKVSRRLQKDFNGQMTTAVWDVDMKWFDGLPLMWLKKCSMILMSLKS